MVRIVFEQLGCGNRLFEVGRLDSLLGHLLASMQREKDLLPLEAASDATDDRRRIAVTHSRAVSREPHSPVSCRLHRLR
jgi:hypothetical protein